MKKISNWFAVSIFIASIIFFGGVLWYERSYYLPYQENADIIVSYHRRGVWYLFGHILKHGEHAADCPLDSCDYSEENPYHSLIRAEKNFQHWPSMSHILGSHVFIDRYGQQYRVVYHDGVWALPSHMRYIIDYYIPLTGIVENPVK